MHIYSYSWSPDNNDDIDSEDEEDDMWEGLVDVKDYVSYFDILHHVQDSVFLTITKPST